MARRILETREVEGEKEVKDFRDFGWEIAAVAPGTKPDGTAYFVHLMARYSEDED
ncbi:hypothetical protein JJQ97_22920 [Pseudomonas syringae]|uniref:hypothetical protein n=1 Tax=Pseudomonas syringae TaxID=317 RepID=UPI001916CA68|nr:hypothetical protein [Pseudomonas syringae]QQQ50144.1 hypothetical protein JJQ97_22920 [Pseudomonas syringae]